MLPVARVCVHCCWLLRKVGTLPHAYARCLRRAGESMRRGRRSSPRVWQDGRGARHSPLSILAPFRHDARYELQEAASLLPRLCGAAVRGSSNGRRDATPCSEDWTRLWSFGPGILYIGEASLLYLPRWFVATCALRLLMWAVVTRTQAWSSGWTVELHHRYISGPVLFSTSGQLLRTASLYDLGRVTGDSAHEASALSHRTNP